MNLNQLKKIKKEDILRFSLKGVETKAKVVYIYDGDSCDVVIQYNGNWERFKCRLLGYDAEELDEDSHNAKLARDYLAHLCMGKHPDDFDEDEEVYEEKALQKALDENKHLVYAIFSKFDSFGRALVTLKKSAKDEESINDLMKEYVDDLEKD